MCIELEKSRFKRFNNVSHRPMALAIATEKKKQERRYIYIEWYRFSKASERK